MVTGRGAACIDHTTMTRYHHALIYMYHQTVHSLISQPLLPTGNQHSAFQGNIIPKQHTTLSCPIGKYHTTYQCLLRTMETPFDLPGYPTKSTRDLPSCVSCTDLQASFHATFKPRSTRPSSLVPLDLQASFHATFKPRSIRPSSLVPRDLQTSFHATFKPRSTRPSSLVPRDLLINPSTSIRCLGLKLWTT